jgi:hypothetical protein
LALVTKKEKPDLVVDAILEVVGKLDEGARKTHR